MTLEYKLVVYVPIQHADAVREAIANAGAGKIGKYSNCSFSSRGTGRFRSEEGALPFIDAVGKSEVVTEERIEVTVRREVVDDVISAMKRVHPYEEIAYDLYPLEIWRS